MAGLGRMGRGTIGVIAVTLLAGGVSAQANKPIERKLLVASFENIIVIGDITVNVETGKSASAIASGDRRTLDSLKLERVGNTLRVRLQDVINNNRGVPITAPLIVSLTTQGIKDMTLNGNGALSVSEVLQPDGVRILLSGNGSIAVGRVAADQFSATVNGNGKIDLGGGAVRDGRVTVNGSGSFDGAKVQMRKLRIEHIGNGTSDAMVGEGTDIFNRGSGNITISGKGTCFVKEAGAASINCAKIDTGSSK